MIKPREVQRAVILQIIQAHTAWIVDVRKRLEADPANADLQVEARIALARFELLRETLAQGSVLMAGAA